MLLGSNDANIKSKLDLDKSMAVHARAATALIRAAVFPRSNIILPPYMLSPTSYCQQLIVSGKFTCSDDKAIPGLMVPTQTGMVIQLPKRGCVSLWHCGFVNNFTTNVNFPAPVSAPIGGIHFLKSFAIPWDGSIKTKSISISPNVAKNFSRGRIVQGEITIRTGALPIGQTSFSGTASYGAPGDTRDMAQTASGNAFDQSDIAAMSMTTKDGRAQYQAVEGAVWLVGNDIAMDLTPPSADHTIQRIGSAVEIHPDDMVGTSTQLNALVAGGVGSAAYAQLLWFSPWAIDPVAVPTDFVAGTGYQNFNSIGAIDEGGICEFDWAFKFAIQATNGNQQYQIQVTACHVFAKALDPAVAGANNIGLQTISETREFTTFSYTGAPVYRDFSCKFQPMERYYNSDYYSNLRGKYVGSAFTILVTKLTAGLEGSLQFNITDSNVMVSSPTSGLPGWVGPARIYRYDGITAGSELVMDGVINAQVLPNGTLQTFTKDSMQSGAEVADVSALPLLNYVFNSENTPVKRMWTFDEYVAFAATYKQNWSPKLLRNWTLEDAKGEQAAASTTLDAATSDPTKQVVKPQSGGIGDLLGSVGGIVGGPLGALAGNTIGRMFGGACNDYGAIHSSPSVQDRLLANAGRLQVAGQYGAGGNYASAAGQYGAGSSQDAAFNAAFGQLGRRLRG